ncbi:hypothetical protein [Sinorhizobium fredii]|nr:hypothetical protein [Sinorhizobium fredii]
MLGTISPSYDQRVKTFEEDGPPLVFGHAIDLAEVQEKRTETP